MNIQKVQHKPQNSKSPQLVLFLGCIKGHAESQAPTLRMADYKN